MLLALIVPVIPAVAKQPPVRVLSNEAAANPDCGPVSSVLGYIAHKYGETVYWFGDTDGGVTMLLTQRPDTRTWTMLAVRNGTACMVSSGGTRRAQGS